MRARRRCPGVDAEIALSFVGFHVVARVCWSPMSAALANEAPSSCHRICLGRSGKAKHCLACRASCSCTTIVLAKVCKDHLSTFFNLLPKLGVSIWMARGLFGVELQDNTTFIVQYITFHLDNCKGGLAVAHSHELPGPTARHITPPIECDMSPVCGEAVENSIGCGRAGPSM